MSFPMVKRVALRAAAVVAPPRLGIAIGEEEVRAVLVGRNGPAWSSGCQINDGDAIAAVTTVLDGLPGCSRRTRVVASLPGRASQLRLLRDLPPVADDRIARAFMAQNARRYFLKNGIPLATSGIAWIDATEGWSSAFELPLISAVGSVCLAKGLRLAAVVHATTAAAAAADLGAATAAAGGDESQGGPFAEAYGAAHIALDHPLAHRPSRGKDDRDGRRLSVAAAVAASAIALAVAGPGVAGLFIEGRARADLASMAGDRAAISVEEQRLERLDRELRAVLQFASAARSYPSFLAELTSGLPKQDFISSLRCDSAGGTAVLLAARASDAISAVEGLASVAAADVVGPITRETIQGEPRERVTVHFTWAVAHE